MLWRGGGSESGVYAAGDLAEPDYHADGRTHGSAGAGEHREFCRTQASMAVYLSAGMVKELSKRLMDGGYAPDTPAAIVYKATWPDEEAYVCTVETLAAVAVEHQITKTALILVGDVLAAAGYERSKLYDPGFTTGYRKAKRNRERQSEEDGHSCHQLYLQGGRTGRTHSGSDGCRMVL